MNAPRRMHRDIDELAGFGSSFKKAFKKVASVAIAPLQISAKFSPTHNLLNKFAPKLSNTITSVAMKPLFGVKRTPPGAVPGTYGIPATRGGAFGLRGLIRTRPIVAAPLRPLPSIVAVPLPPLSYAPSLPVVSLAPVLPSSPPGFYAPKDSLLPEALTAPAVPGVGAQLVQFYEANKKPVLIGGAGLGGLLLYRWWKP